MAKLTYNFYVIARVPCVEAQPDIQTFVCILA